MVVGLVASTSTLGQLGIGTQVAEGLPWRFDDAGNVSGHASVPLFLIVYFLILRPQQKKAKDHQALITKLSTGDEVVPADQAPPPAG